MKCYALTFAHRKRAHPSACGMTSCFKSSLNAPSSFDITNSFELMSNNVLATSSTPRGTYFKLVSFTNATCVCVFTCTHIPSITLDDTTYRKPSGMIMLTLVYYATEANTLRLLTCNSNCAGSGKLDGLFFSYLNKGKMLPRCTLVSSSVEATRCYQPRCYPFDTCSTSVRARKHTYMQQKSRKFPNL